MKVDNFVLLIISIVTLIVISLLTECNRGRLTELENKATKEIVETFFHLGSAEPTELGQKGYLITRITESKYGGRSRQQVIDSIENHNTGDYISETEKDAYGSDLFDSNISGIEKNPVDCNLTIGSSTNINMIPYHHVQPNNNYSYGGLNCQDKYGSDYIYQDTNYNLYNIPTIFGVGSNIYTPNKIVLGGIYEKEESLSSQNLEISIQNLNIVLYNITHNDYIFTVCGTTFGNINEYITPTIFVSINDQIKIKYDIQLIQDPSSSSSSHYKLIIIVKVELIENTPNIDGFTQPKSFENETIENFIGKVSFCDTSWFRDSVTEQYQLLKTEFNNFVDAIGSPTINHNLQNRTFSNNGNEPNNELMLYTFKSTSVLNNKNNNMTFNNFDIISNNPIFTKSPINNLEITLTKNSLPNNYTIDITGNDKSNFGTAGNDGPNINLFKNTDQLYDMNEYEILKFISTNDFTFSTNYSYGGIIFKNNSNYCNNLSVINILEKLNNKTITLT